MADLDVGHPLSPRPPASKHCTKSLHFIFCLFDDFWYHGQTVMIDPVPATGSRHHVIGRHMQPVFVLGLSWPFC